MKQFIKRVLFPPLWLVILLIPLAAALLAAVFINGLDETWLAYPVYVLSAYTLAVTVADVVTRLPKRYRRVRARMESHPVGHRYLNDPAFKVQVSLIATLTVNILFAVFHIGTGMLTRSYWSITIGVYYFILAVMRGLTFRRSVRLKRVGDPLAARIAELKTFRAVGAVLVLVNLTLSGIVILVIRDGHTYEYAGYLIYAMAAYTFYITVYSLVTMIRYRRYKSPLISASKIISFSAALVSMLSLETAMLTAFGGADDTGHFRQMMVAATGAVVCMLVLSMAAYMVMQATRALHTLDRPERRSHTDHGE